MTVLAVFGRVDSRALPCTANRGYIGEDWRLQAIADAKITKQRAEKCVSDQSVNNTF